MAIIYHPDLDTSVDVPEEAVHIHRQSGWMTLSEWQANLAETAAREEADQDSQDEAPPPAPTPAAGRSAVPPAPASSGPPGEKK
jgi:hypothetical protein